MNTRQQALSWWNTLSEELQAHFTQFIRKSTPSSLSSLGLTGREIERVWETYRYLDTPNI